ncbi:MAG: hypothetical protein ABW277_14915 [Longimicrobiaceae bacterium]
MPFMGEVSTDDKMQVTFRADAGNQGSSALATGFVPDGVNPPAPTEFDMVAPGAVETQHTRIRPAFGVKITVDVPAGGSGFLEVVVNDELRDRAQVGDVVWTYGIV